MRARAGDKGRQILKRLACLERPDALRECRKLCGWLRPGVSQVQSAEHAHGKFQHQKPNFPLILQPGRMTLAIAPARWLMTSRHAETQCKIIFNVILINPMVLYLH
jgi:hypothetical protein